jgi:hypothetical protein
MQNSRTSSIELHDGFVFQFSHGIVNEHHVFSALDILGTLLKRAGQEAKRWLNFARHLDAEYFEEVDSKTYLTCTAFLIRLPRLASNKHIEDKDLHVIIAKLQNRRQSQEFVPS